MKIVVLYGDDTVASYNRFIHIIDEIKKRGWDHIQIKSAQKLSEQLVSTSLFEGERLLSLFDANKVSQKEYEWLLNSHKTHEGRLLLYFQSAIPATIKKFLPKEATYEEFKLKKELYSFLDAFYPGNGKRCVQLLHKICETDAVELVMALLARHLRDLAWVESGAKGLNLPSWRLQKLTTQVRKFSEGQLKTCIAELAEADVKSKTGQGDLITLLDIILLKCL